MNTYAYIALVLSGPNLRAALAAYRVTNPEKWEGIADCRPTIEPTKFVCELKDHPDDGTAQCLLNLYRHFSTRFQKHTVADLKEIRGFIVNAPSLRSVSQDWFNHGFDLATVSLKLNITRN